MNDEMKMMMDEDKELWVSIDGFDGYEVSSKGRVRSYWKPLWKGNDGVEYIKNDEPVKLLKPIDDGQGYWRVNLKGKKLRISRLLAIAFIPNPDGYECVDHIDGNRKNNSLSNLRWCSKKQNSLNTKKPTNNTSGHKGVYNNQSWGARWSINGKRKFKSFKTLEEAIEHREKMTGKKIELTENNNSGYVGVFKFDMWVVQWREDGEKRHKDFKTKEEAIEYRKKMVEEHYDMNFYKEG